MNKLITRLSSELAKELSTAEEIFIAVALLNDKGLNFLLQDLKDNCRIKLLIGIDLPTTPEVLRRLTKLQNIDVRIYSDNSYFHPKLYIFKSGDDIKIFVGSSNFTNGGLNGNIELSLVSSDKDACIDALRWFNDAFSSSKLLSDEFLNKYELLFRDGEKQREEEKKNLKKLKELLMAPNRESSLDLLTNDYYFVKEDYETFQKDKIDKETFEIEKERLKVRTKMIRLERLLSSKIKLKKWKIYPTSTNDGVSLIKLTHKRKEINSIWLHFGKKGADKGIGTFSENIRLQVIVSGDLRLSGGYGVGTWLMVGKKLGSLEDRDYIKRNLVEPTFQNNFYNLIKELGDDYFIKVNNQTKACDSVDHPTLIEFVRGDKLDEYFIIGRDFEPNDIALFENNIVNLIMTEFDKLYPIYLLLKFKD